MDFDLRTVLENALILVREQASRRGIAPVCAGTGVAFPVQR